MRSRAEKHEKPLEIIGESMKHDKCKRSLDDGVIREFCSKMLCKIQPEARMIMTKIISDDLC